MSDLFNSLDLTETVSHFQLAEKIKDRIVFKKRLSGNSIYQFCPICLKRFGIKTKDIQRWITLRNSERRKSEEERQFLMMMDEKLQHEENGEKVKNTLFEVRYKELVKVDENTGQVMYNTYLECPICFKKITMDDFYGAYCEPPKSNLEKKYINLSDPMWETNF